MTPVDTDEKKKKREKDKKAHLNAEFQNRFACTLRRCILYTLSGRAHITHHRNFMRYAHTAHVTITRSKSVDNGKWAEHTAKFFMCVSHRVDERSERTK